MVNHLDFIYNQVCQLERFLLLWESSCSQNATICYLLDVRVKQATWRLHFSFGFLILNPTMLKLAVASESNPWYHWTGQQPSPHTPWICKLLSFPVVTHFGNIATCPWSPPFSSSFLAALPPQDGLTATHGCIIASECDISMLPLKLLAVKVGSCWAPFPPPALWFRHYTMFFLCSLLYCTAHFGQIGYFMSYFVH